MEEFKVGDRIRIKSWEQMEKEYGLDESGHIDIMPYFVTGMKNLCGKEAIIKSIESKNEFTKLEDLVDHSTYFWNFCSKMFEHVSTRDTNFKVGDKVRIRDWEDMKKEFGVENLEDGENIPCKYSFTSKMKHLCGRTVVLEKINSDGFIFLSNWSDNSDTGWSFSTDMIEKIKEDKQEINTYRKENEVISELKVNDKIIKTAKAKCCPTDTFDFTIGAKLSLERLFEDKKDAYIRLLNSGGYSFNKKGDILKAYKFENGVAFVRTEDQIRSVGGCTSEEWTYLKYEYEILKDYVPKDKKEVKEVKRVAKVGEYIKLTETLFTFDEVGDILKVKEVHSDKIVVNGMDHSGLNTRNIEVYKTEDRNYWNDDCEYVVLEGYVPENADNHAEYKENDKAKVGDYIELLEESYSFDKVGIILKVNEVGDNGLVYILPESYPKEFEVYNSWEGDGWSYCKEWYKVLKDYVPPKQNKGKDLIGRKITAGTRFKVINISPERNTDGCICIDEYIGKTAKFEWGFTFTENGFHSSGTFDKKYMNGIDEENGNGLCWRWDEVEILD